MFFIVLILFFEVLDEEENHDAVVFLTEIDYQSLILVSMKHEGCGVVLTCIICVVAVVLCFVSGMIIF